MTWHTHVTVGANVVWLIPLLNGNIDERVVIAGAIGGVSALLSDIDSREAKIFYIFKKVFSIFKGNKLKHRGFLHSFLGISMIGVFSLLLTLYFNLDWSLFFAFIFGYISHPLIDGFTEGGVYYFFPSEKEIRLLPEKWCTTTGGKGDVLLFFMASFSLVVFFWLYNQDFTASQNFLSLF